MISGYPGTWGAALVGSGWVLIECADQPARLVMGLRSPYAWVAEVGPDTAAITLAAALLWLIALWTAGVLGVTALALLPGRVGRHAHAVAAAVTPAVLRRVLGTAVGTSILISPNPAFADSTATPAPLGASASPTFSAAPSLPMDRPGDPSSRSGSPEAPSQPAFEWPTDPADPPGPADPAGPGDQAPSAAPKPANPAPAISGDHVRVRPGDSLWSIAAHRLGADGSATQIQGEWPRWYAVNRQRIGPDPNLLRPGMRLLAPQPAAPEAGE